MGGDGRDTPERVMLADANKRDGFRLRNPLNRAYAMFIGGGCCRSTQQ